MGEGAKVGSFGVSSCATPENLRGQGSASTSSTSTHDFAAPARACAPSTPRHQRPYACRSCFLALGSPVVSQAPLAVCCCCHHHHAHHHHLDKRISIGQCCAALSLHAQCRPLLWKFASPLTRTFRWIRALRWFDDRSVSPAALQKANEGDLRGNMMGDWAQPS